MLLPGDGSRSGSVLVHPRGVCVPLAGRVASGVGRPVPGESGSVDMVARMRSRGSKRGSQNARRTQQMTERTQQALDVASTLAMATTMAMKGAITEALRAALCVYPSTISAPDRK